MMPGRLHRRHDFLQLQRALWVVDHVAVGNIPLSVYYKQRCLTEQT